ncbi:MAG: hypothetical protein GY719_34535 [bacterium]|nr:hypothetical protein [bacterium]
MIAFATLFLGLFFGVKPVEVVVGEGVAAVELRLDGERLGMLRGEPWVMECDFGDELAPRHLEAVAYDAEGRELNRISQWLNLPQPEVVTSVIFEPREPGQPRAARLAWESTVGAEPESVIASLDGRPLAVAEPRRIVLPAVDEKQLHLLSVELQFEDHVTSSVDVTFGGAYADEVSTEITALAIRATGKGRTPPSATVAADWFEKDGEPLEVIAIEKETAELVVVKARPFPRFFGPGESHKVPKSLLLSGDQRVRFVTPVPTPTEGVAATFNLFPISQAFDGGLGDLYRLLTGLVRRPEERSPRLNAAVTVAGLAAYRGRHRRAVVLIPGSKPGEREALSPAQARRYLEHLRVPFFVWNPESRTPAYLEDWGEVRDVGSIKKLAAAFEEVDQLLGQQWIVWLDGRHLPQEIELSPEVRGFELLQ